MAELDPTPVSRLRKSIKKLRYSYRSLPDKKQYIEFFTALLSVPVLLTVIILNLNNLKGKEEEPKVKDTVPIVVTIPESKTTIIPQTSSAACKKGIGPISISSPEANEVIEDNPVQISIDYDQGEYCAAVWAYSINNGRYSDYSSSSIALYNPPNGTIRFQLKVKSVVTGEEKILNRSFTYQGSASPTTTPVASSSAN